MHLFLCLSSSTSWAHLGVKAPRSLPKLIPVSSDLAPDGSDLIAAKALFQSQLEEEQTEHLLTSSQQMKSKDEGQQMEETHKKGDTD